MVVQQSLFPHAKQGLSKMASDAPVLLNGMRVLFDEKVALYPVELEAIAPPPPPDKRKANGRNGG